MLKLWKIGALILGASLLMAGPSNAAVTAFDDEEEQQVEENQDEMICRRVHVTGSRIPERHCFTRREWTNMREEAQEELDEQNHRSNVVDSDEDH